MGFINAIIGLVSDPRAAIAGWIAASPLTAFGLIFLVIFIETGVVFMPDVYKRQLRCRRPDAGDVLLRRHRMGIVRPSRQEDVR